MNRLILLILWAICLAMTIPLGADEPDPFAECEALVRKAPDTLDSYFSFMNTAVKHGLFEEAAARLEAMLERDQENARARYVLAHTLAKIPTERKRSVDVLVASCEGLAACGEYGAAVDACFFSTLPLSKQHRTAEADAQMALAEETARESGDVYLLARAHLYQGEVARRRRNLDRAWRMLKLAENEAFPDGPLQIRGKITATLGGVASGLGRTEEAISAYRQALACFRESGNIQDQASTLANLATLTYIRDWEKGGDYAEVRVMAQEALAVAIGANKRSIEATAHLLLGRATVGEEGLSHLEQALAIAREIRHARKIVEALRALALRHAEWDPGYIDLSLEFLDEAHSLAGQTNLPFDAAGALHDRVCVRWIAGHRDQALSDSWRVIDAMEELFSQTREMQFRTEFVSVWGSIYASLAGQILEHSRGEPTAEELAIVFSATERIRARILLETLETDPVEIPPENPVLQQHQEILEGISRTQRRLLDPALQGGERELVLADLDRLEQQETSLRIELTEAGAGPLLLSANISFPTLDHLRANLGRDEAVLYFVVHEGDTDCYLGTGAWLLLHTRAGTSVHTLPHIRELGAAVDLFTGLFSRRDGSEAAGAAQLYDNLLKEALYDLPREVRKLIIVPDGILHWLPFGALRPSPGEIPLSMRYQVSQAPSAATWLRWRGSRPPAATIPALAMVDPILPLFESKEGSGTSEKRAWALDAGQRLGPLPRARREARAIKRHLGGESRSLVGSEASEQFIKESDLQQFAVLHFAAHAVMDDASARRSAVLLAPGVGGEDGLLQAREVAGLGLDGQVVVLAACSSASGTLLQGEGVVGLARAFFQAGAQTVVGSLWPMRDDEAAELFERFYRHLGRGQSVGQALTGAVRDAIDDDRPAAAWAGLVVLGNADAVPLPGGRPGPVLPWPYLVLTALLIAGSIPAFILWRRRT